MALPEIDQRQIIPWDTRWRQMIAAVEQLDARLAALESGGGESYMLAATYDPTSIAASAFLMDNMVEGATTKILTADERTKLASVETNATGDQTGAEIKSAYEAEADTNAFTDAEKTKVGVAATLTALAQEITGGFRVDPYDIGTVSSGTTTLDPGNGPLQKMGNNGASTLAPGTNTGAFILTITNGASAGALTTSGWTEVSGSAFTTTNGHIFTCHCVVDDGGSHMIVQARQ